MGAHRAATVVRLTGRLSQIIFAMFLTLLFGLPLFGLGLVMALFNPETDNKLLGIAWALLGLFVLGAAWWAMTPRRLEIGDEGIRWYVWGRLCQDIPWSEVALVRVKRFSRVLPLMLTRVGFFPLFLPVPIGPAYRLSVFSRRPDGKQERRWSWDFGLPGKLEQILEAVRFYHYHHLFGLELPR